MNKILEIVRRYIIRTLVPVSKWVGSLAIPPSKRMIKQSDCVDIREAILAGDVILTKSIGEFTNLFIPGEYKHAAMYCGNGDVVEAVGTGVRIIDLDRFLGTKDYVIVLSALFDGGAKAAEEALKLCGYPYDYEFEPNEMAFYCSELIVFCYNKSNPNSPFQVRDILSVKTVLPDDFRLAAKKFKPVIVRPK